MAGAVRIVGLALLALFAHGVCANNDREVLERARARIARERTEVHGWLTHNATEQGNWTWVHDDDAALAAPLHDIYAPVDGDHVFPRNVSGFFDGNFSAHTYATRDANATRVAHDRGALDWFAKKTRLEAQLYEQDVQHTNVSQVWGSIVVTLPRNTSQSRVGIELDVNGVLVPQTGRLYVVAMPRTSPRILDIREVLAMVPLNDTQLVNDTYTAVVHDMDDRLARIDAMLAHHESLAPSDAPNAEGANNCSMHLYGQLAPLGTRADEAALRLREDQLARPNGIVTRRIPPMHLALVGVSDACGLRIGTPALEGIAMRQFWDDTRWYLLGMMGIVMVQLVLMMRMSERLRTESAIAKVSGVSFFIQTMYDAHVCLAHLIVGASLNSSLSLGMFAVAFLAGVLFLAYEYPLVVTVLRQSVQPAPPPPPPPTAQETNAAPGEAPAPETNTAPGDALASGPAADARPAWSVRLAAVRGAVANTARDMPRVSVSFVVTLVAFVISIVMPSLLAMLLIPVLFSFWVPQIVHNVRVRASGVYASTAIGMTLTRFYLPLCTCETDADLFWYPHNLLFFERTRVVWLPIVWLVVQMLVLVGQDLFGPLFFVPRAWREHEAQWDWHPTPEALDHLLRDADDVEVPAVRDAPDVPLGDCPVCLAPNTWEAEETDDAEDVHLLGGASARGAWWPWGRRRAARSNVMVTPCKHIFHTACLEPWMSIRHACPSCRLPLPPYEEGGRRG
ncbi:hypothetical protein MBRA1_002830 [Malassezia brasiliensis]|uniref:RING-type E3 ubiquitin transferase n=1 Tax=Malassezia brasiliensis TaxID=1821822 RepID=A0AAF0DY70_9BASI|nr:hypothetical protein MBRA1_002830 [Malassezia brasiliensis]